MKFLSLLIILFSASTVSALEIKGVNVSDSISVQGKSLSLIGAGLRKKSIVDLYVASLYSASKQSSDIAVIDNVDPMLLKLHIVSGLVGAKQLNQAIIDGFKANHSKEELEQINSEIEKLKTTFSTQKISTDSIVDFAFSDENVNISLNGKELVSFKSREFKKALLRIWLGTKPVDANLKTSLLSK
ncbi:MAG: chalcone isomerase family protein [Brevinema sp.]